GGQAGYAAANAYLDALAADRRRRGLAGLSVAWGPWGGGGMAALDGAEADLRRRGIAPLDPDDAFAALEAALAHGTVALSVADVDWARFGPTFTVRRPSPLLADLLPAEPATTAAGPDLGGPDAARRVLDLVRTHAATALGYAGPDAIDPDRAFKDL